MSVGSRGAVMFGNDSLGVNVESVGLISSILGSFVQSLTKYFTRIVDSWPLYPLLVSL